MNACERCKGTGADPENESVETYGDVERRLPESCANCQLEDKPVEQGELWSLIDWTLWGSGMGDVFRESLADSFIRSLTSEQIRQAEELMQAWHDSGREPLGRRRYEDMKKELDEARMPQRGDAVATWLRAQRNAASDYPEAYQVTDGLLDLYRLHADMGLRLDEHACEARVIGDCDCLESSSPPPNSQIKRAKTEDPWLGRHHIDVGDLMGFIAVAPAESDPPQGSLEQQRDALIEAMGGVSEERWSAGWLIGLERRLYNEGGIWEIIGRAIGWPTGKFRDWTWATWDEAGEIFKSEDSPKVEKES